MDGRKIVKAIIWGLILVLLAVMCLESILIAYFYSREPKDYLLTILALNWLVTAVGVITLVIIARWKGLFGRQ